MSADAVTSSQGRCRGPVDVRRALYVSCAMVTTFAVVRCYVHRFPHSNFDLGGYNIHHLFTGLLLMVAGGVPLVLWRGRTPMLDACALVFGAGLALCLDEWVYLIVTDGSDSSYLLPVSLWGGVVMIGLALAYILSLVWVFRRRSPRDGERVDSFEPPTAA